MTTMLTCYCYMVLALLSVAVLVDAQQQQPQQCAVKRRSDSEWGLEKRVWTVGVLAIRGPDAAYEEFNTLFSEYLTATAGRAFDPPIQFQMKPLNFLTLFSDTEAGLVDFIYVNPSAFSCIESEYGARSLASQVSRRVVGGKTYQLKRFGGVIATLANRTDIESIQDLKDKVIAAASISGLGSGQMQFRELQNANMSWIQDPKQLVFTSNQGKVVNGLLKGDFDVGFIRTDQLESSKDSETGKPIDTSLFKVIGPRPGLHIDHVPFPFQSSTPLYPEWNVAALDHVPDVLSTELQSAMLDVGRYSKIGELKQRCLTEGHEEDCESYESALWTCDSRLGTADGVADVAEVAFNATRRGEFSEFVPTLSYMELRAMQEATGFIERVPSKNVWRCLRSAEIYDSISCPAGHVKKTKDQVENGCADAGLVCKEGFQCICSPCYVPFECVDSVDVMGRCVSYSVFLPAILVPIAVLFIATCFGVLGWKSKQMVRQAETAAKNERDLNEFIAHEVRNPLSAALSASVFVNTAVQADINEVTLDSVREDAGIISSSLRFINDLLRSMLDVHRATKDQMILEQDSVDILYDVLQPVASMIYARDTNFAISTDCSEGLVVRSDRLRLQQIVLNLARNSAKFVAEGYLRLRADVIDGSVHLFVEDSGPGIPEEKRLHLFNRYQKSLDSLAQGTGVGLSLVQKLVSLMDASITLDSAWRSGYKEYPGTRFVIDLKKAPEEIQSDDKYSTRALDLEEGAAFHDLSMKLPQKLSVLLVDDDRNLRQMARRLLERVVPTWKIHEAASGESCIQLCGNEVYDLIFMDQYMTSVEQSLKGTETVRILRSRGNRSVICGLSANNLNSVFLGAGANHFHLKPFPSDLQELCELLLNLVGGKQRGLHDDQSMTTSDTSSSDMTSVRSQDLPRDDSTAEISLGIEEEGTATEVSIPEDLSVLFVDDDRTLRRLATRALKKLLPEASVRDTNSGESALMLCESGCGLGDEKKPFDVIFMDQYMTSVNDSMLGTEAVRKLRKLGVTESVVVGISANQSQEREFLEVGADHFILKPFPCKQEELRQALVEILTTKREKV